MNIVIIDNRQQDLSRLADALTAAIPLCHIQSFADPLLSAKYICNFPVDMVFLAESMRPVDGFVLLNVLRANKPDLPIVMLSDRGLHREHAFSAGVNGYYAKSITAHTLKQISEDIPHHLRTSQVKCTTPQPQKRKEKNTMEQNVKIEALSQDPVFIKALADCATTEDAQQLFAAKEISLSGEALLETCLTLLRCGEKSGALSEDDLLQVAAGTSNLMANYLNKTGSMKTGSLKKGVSLTNAVSSVSS
ncbi:MAG: response regulator, partial [Oscillospiraceae bacterium]